MADVKELNINNTTYDIKAKTVVNQNGGSLKYWTGTKSQYDAIATKDATTLYFLSDVGKIYFGDTLISNNSNGKNIGELVYSSLPQTDAGLHLLDGALIQGSGSYSAFVDYIADLYTANPMANYFTDETTWQNTVTQYGVCGKFVYDSTNNTVRLPKVTGIIEGTIDITALGDLIEAGLPNITGTPTLFGDFLGTGYGGDDYSGAFHIWSNGSANLAGGNGWMNYRTDFAASRSSSIYKDNFNKVQPQTIKCFVYIVIANSTKTDIQVDIDEIATDLNGKADTDLSNTTDQAKILMSGMGMPSDKHINLTLGASGSTYTAPANGYFDFRKGGNAGQFGRIGSDIIETGDTLGNNSVVTLFLPVNKGDVMTVLYNLTGTIYAFRFIYAQGSESEAN